jgi:hypothetical protein
MITPIYNEARCATGACHAHPKKQKVLGVLDVALDLQAVDRDVRAIHATAILVSPRDDLCSGASDTSFYAFFFSCVPSAR